MTRRNLFYIVVAFVVGVTVWIFFVDRSLKQTQYELVNEVYVQKNQNRQPSARAPAAAPRSAMSARQQTLLQDLERLNQQILEAEAQRNRQQQNLETLQTQMTAQTQGPTSYATQIRDYQTEIRQFIEGMQRNESIKSEVVRQSTFLLSDQEAAAQVAREQLNENILNQENFLRQLQEQISYWQNNGSYVNEQQLQLQELQVQWNDQNMILQDLKSQRSSVDLRVQEGARSIQEQKEQTLSDLADDSASLQQEVQGLRQEVQRLQTSEFQQQRSQMSLRSQIQQLQGTLQRHDTSLQGLRADYVNKQQQLETISNTDRTTARE